MVTNKLSQDISHIRVPLEPDVYIEAFARVGHHQELSYRLAHSRNLFGLWVRIHSE
jgi:hypothetical protein